VPITNDQLVEGTERFLGQIISGGGITGLDITAPTATVDITDNDSKHTLVSLCDWNFYSLSFCNKLSIFEQSLQSLSFFKA
jgi:hypothetical protein